jgi:hypothetical protein
MDAGCLMAQGRVMPSSIKTGGAMVWILAAVVGCHSASPPPQARRSDVTPYVRRDATTPAHPSPAPGSNDIVTASPTDPPPGSAQAVAQRAAIYARSIAPLAADRQTPKSRERQKADGSDSPDPETMRFTPQADFEPTRAVANAELPKSQPGPVAAPPASASVDLRTSHKLVTTDAPSHAERPIAASAGADTAARIVNRARDFPADPAAQVDDQLAKYLRDETVPDMATLAGLAPEDREMVGAMMDALSNFRSQLRAENNMLFSKKVQPLVELSDRLRSQAELGVPTVALCRGVHAFGVYEPMDPARFIAGVQQEAIVYCEVENFLSQPNDRNLYETRLTQSIVLYAEASGVAAWTPSKDTIVDQARRRRHDFYLAKRIMLPPNLSIGRYLLKVTIEDQQAHHIAENTTPLEIVAQ